MATNAAKQATRVVRGGPISVDKKHTVHSTGVWERIRATLSIDPKRSTGVPLNSQFRNPPPGALDPTTYDDPVTIPAGDIADNPYWKRDMRRSYPKLSVIGQGDVVGLLQLGSKANPREDVPLIGEAGTKQLVEVKAEGEKGLSAYFEKSNGSVSKAVLGADGLPPTPAGWYRPEPSGRRAYVMQSEEEQSYGDAYPCRTFV